jgi:prolyl-tRNA synthetase
VNEGEGCPRCGEPLKLGKTVEIGHIFKLGTKYADSMGAKVLDKDGKEVTLIMGSYGIGVERILTSCIEQNHDDNGFWLAPSIAPFTVVVVPTNVKDAALLQSAEKIAAELEAAGYDVLLDDRDERPGVKFKDADLVGIPYRINIGKKLAEGNVEVVQRAKSLSADVAVGDILSHLRELYDPRA